MESLELSLDNLTRALQKLTREEQNTKRKPIILPRYIPSSFFKASKEIEEFLETRREYQKRTNGVSVGQY